MASGWSWRVSPPPRHPGRTRPHLAALAQDESLLPSFVRACPVAQKYLRLLGPLDWVAENNPKAYKRRLGCTTTMAASIGARLRYQLDWESEAYKQLYNQRTASERINSQAVELGIERPKIRNGQAIANINTLIFVECMKSDHRTARRLSPQATAL